MGRRKKVTIEVGSESLEVLRHTSVKEAALQSVSPPCTYSVVHEGAENWPRLFPPDRNQSRVCKSGSA